MRCENEALRGSAYSYISINLVDPWRPSPANDMRERPPRGSLYKETISAVRSNQRTLSISLEPRTTITRSSLEPHSYLAPDPLFRRRLSSSIRRPDSTEGRTNRKLATIGEPNIYHWRTCGSRVLLSPVVRTYRWQTIALFASDRFFRFYKKKAGRGRACEAAVAGHDRSCSSRPRSHLLHIPDRPRPTPWPVPRPVSIRSAGSHRHRCCWPHRRRRRAVRWKRTCSRRPHAPPPPPPHRTWARDWRA